MSTVLEKIGKYKKLHSEILNLFGIENGYELIEDFSSDIWFKNEGHTEIEYIDCCGVEYNFDYAVQCGKEVDGCILFYVQDNGEKYYAIFSALMRENDYDNYQKQIGIEF